MGMLLVIPLQQCLIAWNTGFRRSRETDIIVFRRLSIIVDDIKRSRFNLWSVISLFIYVVMAFFVFVCPCVATRAIFDILAFQVPCLLACLSSLHDHVQFTSLFRITHGITYTPSMI